MDLSLSLCTIPLDPAKAPWVPETTRVEIDRFNTGLRVLQERLDGHGEAVEGFVHGLDLLGDLDSLTTARESLRAAVVTLYQDMLRHLGTRAAIIREISEAAIAERRAVEVELDSRITKIREAVAQAGITTDALIIDRDATVLALRRRIDVLRATGPFVTPPAARQAVEGIVSLCQRRLRGIFLANLVEPIALEA